MLASPHIIRIDIPETVKVIKLNSPKKVIAYLRQLRNIIKRYNIDVVHCNHRRQIFMMRLYQLLYGKIATVWTCHTVPYPNNCLKSLLGYYGHKVIAISTEAANWMHSELGIKWSRIDKVTNGVDNSSLIISKTDKALLKENFFEKHFHERIDGANIKVVVAHGRLDPIKGLDLLIKAFALLPVNQRNNIKIVLSGDTNVPYYQELLSLIEECNVVGDVYFAGWIKSKEILNIADIMVQPSHREGFLLAALEAFFMKVPVIRTKVGGYEDMKDFCIGVPTDNVGAIYEELARWLSNPKGVEGMVERAFSFANEEGTIKAMTLKTVETYKRAIKLCQS